MDRVKLAKILQMTTSSNDNEALSAIRRANEMLKKVNLDWAGLLGEDTAQPFSPFQPPKPKEQPWNDARTAQAQAAITFCMNKTRFASFGILASYLRQNGRLTEAQDKQLWKIYDKLANGKTVTREEANLVAFPFDDFDPFFKP